MSFLAQFRIAITCLIIFASQTACCQTKMDADDSDVAALLRKISDARTEKIEILYRKGDKFAKSCRTGKPAYDDIDAAAACAGRAVGHYDDIGEHILMKGCSYGHNSNHGSDPCEELARRYQDQSRYIEALAALKLPNAPTNDDIYTATVKLRSYKALGNAVMIKKTLDEICWNIDIAGREGYCRELKEMGQPVDMNLANEEARQRKADTAEERRQDRATDDYIKQYRKQKNQETLATLYDTIDKTTASIQQSQADMAQARVNATVIQLAQQNKARGASGYPTSSSSGSSTSSTNSSGSSKPAAKSKSATSDSTNSSDSSSDTSATTSTTDSDSSKPYNPYTLNTNGYNAYSGQGVPADGATNPGETGRWMTAEVFVTCASKSASHSFITFVLTDGHGGLDCNGPYITFANPDKSHPMFYGFSSVVNEKIEAGSTQEIRWPAPYIYRDRPNPAFQAKVTLRYFSAY